MAMKPRAAKFMTPEYRAWCHLRSRCNNPNVKAYRYYGGRGIKVCKRWDDYETFLADVGPRPHGTTLDRINNNGGYEPGNCRWANRSTQNTNRRNTNFVFYKGQKLTLTQWSKKLGVKRSTLAQRYYVYNWSTARCLGGK